MKTTISDDGNTTTVSDGEATWTCNSAEQARKHIPTWIDGDRNGDRPAPVISQGDREAIADCAADKRRAAEAASDGQAYKATETYRYVNGIAELVEKPSLLAGLMTPTQLLASRNPSLLDFIA